MPKKSSRRKVCPVFIFAFCNLAMRSLVFLNQPWRCARLREAMGTADDPEKMWPVSDMADAMRLIVVTKKRLLDHFAQTGKSKISLRELMDMCSDFPEENGDFKSPPLLGVCGIGKKGFWSVVNGLTNMDQGKRCNEEWRPRLIKVKRNWGI